MKKKKPATRTQLLSPENYIRQKSRSLPIYKCFINEGWKEDKMCNIFIIRQHITGNVTVCMYLVDLHCLGVKDTDFHFNVPLEDVEKMISKQKEYISMMEISYEWVHNIIFAALEFADQYEFKPHRDFTSITSHFLEEDNENIPLLEIECGDKNGKPLYVNTGHDPFFRAQQILAQLRRTAGEGNFNYIVEVNKPDEFDENDEFDEDDENDEFDENDEELVAEIADWDIDKQKEVFIELYNKKKHEIQLTDDEEKSFVILTSILTFDIPDPEAIQMQLDIWEKKFEHVIVEENELPNSLFMDVQSDDGEELADMFFTIYDGIFEEKNPKSLKLLVEGFREEVGDAPVCTYLELVCLLNNQKRNFKNKLKEACIKFPNYFLFQQQHFVHFCKETIDLKFYERLFAKQKLPITQYEAEVFFSYYVIIFMLDAHAADLATVLALELFLNKIDYFSEETLGRNLTIFHKYKSEILMKHFNGR